eukprot:COSAG04_NODE_7317_length_1148_cov_1.228789_1_plen_296_part_01
MRFQAPKVPANTMEFKPENAEHFVPAEAQANLEEIVKASMAKGINHFETAKYGCSELMLGIALRKLVPKRSDYILQTKVCPNKDVAKFRELLQTSLDLLAPDDPDSETGSGFIDLFAMHGINRTKEAEWILEPGGCMDVAKEFQAAGKIKHIGFSTHGMSTGIVDVINTGKFDYVNLHYHYIGSYTASGSGDAPNANSRAIVAAKKHDMGMFIISPYDKGGFLYRPSKSEFGSGRCRHAECRDSSNGPSPRCRVSDADRCRQQSSRTPAATSTRSPSTLSGRWTSRTSTPWSSVPR